MRSETLLGAFPAGYRQGDVFRELYEAHKEEGPDDSEDHAKKSFIYQDVSYKEFCDMDERDGLFNAINRGDEDFVRKALMLLPGEDGLKLNLNIVAAHGGCGDAIPACKDRRKLKIKDKGLCLLARCLPRENLRSIILQLGRNDFTAVGCKALMKAIPDTVEDLKLYLAANDIRNAGCIAIAQRVQKLRRLRSLHLALGANGITDQGNDMLAECIPRGLRVFHCHMRWNDMREECIPAREKMWLVGADMPHIKDRYDPDQWFLMY